MFRPVTVVVAAAAFVGGCASTPLAPLTAEQQVFHDQEVRLMFARLIANNSNFGDKNFLFGRREYSHARISIPHEANGRIKLVCTKVFMKPVDILGSREVDLSADVVESQSGIRLSMGKSADVFGQRCQAPYTPFPELEVLSAKPSS